MVLQEKNGLIGQAPSIAYYFELTAVGNSSPAPVYPPHVSRSRKVSVADAELVAKLYSYRYITGQA